MNKNRYVTYSLTIFVLVISTVILPVFAEVTTLQTDKESFYMGEKIKFSGTVEKDSAGLVTIVIRDLNDEFVMLTQALIDHDDSFEKVIEINKKFSEHGVYNATGFILNMTKGATIEFGVSLDGTQIIIDEFETKDKTIEIANTNENVIIEKDLKTEESFLETEIQEKNTIADFVDISKDPQYYIDRYYNEKAYKSWFDRNYPDLTIEEAVGYSNEIKEIESTVQELIDKEIIPEAQATSIVEPVQQSNHNSETAQIILAIVGLGILFGAVYGIKRQVDDNSRQICINRDTLRKKFIQPIIGTNPKEILRTRLAKGEITLEEYEKIRSKLD